MRKLLAALILTMVLLTGATIAYASVCGASDCAPGDRCHHCSDMNPGYRCGCPN